MVNELIMVKDMLDHLSIYKFERKCFYCKINIVKIKFSIVL